jgi:hypothetical protein
MSEDRIKTAYNTFRAGFSDPAKCPAPAWDDAQPWIRDVATVTYLQGKLDSDLLSIVKDAREKLMLYRKERGGEYTGGVEYSVLMSRMDKALGC